MKKFLFLMMLVGLITFGLAGQSLGSTIGFKFTISLGNPDNPTLRLTNTSSDNIQLVDFLMTIGDTAYYFDAIDGAYAQKDPAGDMSSSLVIGDDTSQDLTGTDLFEFLFTGFDPNDIARFYSEIDQDGINSGEDCRSIFFNNGTVDNSMVRVLFSSGTKLYPLSITLPDGPENASYYEFTASQELPTVPIPGAVWLLGSGLIGLVAMRRRKKS